MKHISIADKVRIRSAVKEVLAFLETATGNEPFVKYDYIFIGETISIDNDGRTLTFKIDRSVKTGEYTIFFELYTKWNGTNSCDNRGIIVYSDDFSQLCELMKATDLDTILDKLKERMADADSFYYP